MKRSHAPLWFILKSLEPFKWWLVLQSLISASWAFISIAQNYSLKVLMDRAPRELGNRVPIAGLLPPATWWWLVGLYWVISFRIHDIVWMNVKPKLRKYLATRMMDRMMEHGYRLYQEHFSGSLSNRIKDVLFHTPELLERMIDQFFCLFLTAIVTAGTFWQIDRIYAFAFVAWIGVYVAISIVCNRAIRRLSTTAAEATTSLVGYVVDILVNIVTVRYFARKRWERKNIDKLTSRSVEAEQRRDWYMLRLYAVQETCFLLYEAFCLYILIKGCTTGTVTGGTIVMVLSLNVQMGSELAGLSEDVSRFFEGFGSVAQGLRIVLLPIEQKDKPDAKDLVLSKGEIVFDKVTFQYSKDLKPLFHAQSVTIPGGQKVGLVGYSGSGKSTFIHLILRTFDVTGGRILIDGQDIRDVTQESLHRAIAMVPQDTTLFHRSLMENIRYGNLSASDEVVIEAAKKAEAHQFITSFRDGYHDMVGERGMKLSGGQRQRIAVARGLIKNPGIFMFDEATSQLDSMTEMKVQAHLREFMRDKTSLIVAHRLSTLLVLGVDRILVFDRGRIVQDGSHEALMAQPGLYKTLWEVQIGRFVKNGE